MIVADNKVNAILSSIAGYQTVNILELMSLTPGVNDDDVQIAVKEMQDNDLVKTVGEGPQQMVTLTPKGYDYLASQTKMQMAVSTI